MANEPKRMKVEAGRGLVIDGVRVITITRCDDVAGKLSPGDADAFAHYVASIVDWNDFIKFAAEYRRKP